MHLIFYCDVFRLCCLTKIGFHQECDSHAFVADLTKSIRVGKILPLFPPSLLGGHVYNVCKWHERALFWVYVWINYSQETLKLEYLEGSRRNQPFDRVCLECLEETPTNCGSSGKILLLKTMSGKSEEHRRNCWIFDCFLLWEMFVIVHGIWDTGRKKRKKEKRIVTNP